LDLGRPAEASDALETYLARRPASPTILFFLGQAALQLGQFEKAMKAYTRAIEIYPEYANAYHGLATACARLGDEKAAEKWRAKLAALKAKEGASGNAQADLFRDAQFMPARVADVLTVAGDVYEEQGEIEEAAASWRRAAEVCAAAVTCRRRLAALCHRQGEFREAIEVVGQLRQLEPQATEHLRSLAALHAAMDDFEQAELALKKLCELAPRQGDGYAALAEVYARTNKNLPEARSLASTAVRLEPTARHYAIYGVACERLGDLAAARAALERATAIEPDNPQYRRMVDLLKGRQ
jgi:tetratricopeptide (TPR) repeat protein